MEWRPLRKQRVANAIGLMPMCIQRLRQHAHDLVECIIDRILELKAEVDTCPLPNTGLIPY